MKASSLLPTIKKNTDFQLVFEKGHSMNGRYLVVYFLHNRLGYSRFGFCVGRKLGSAVIRNRIKRLLREAVRTILPPVQSGWDVVLVARNPIITAQFRNICTECEHILVKTGILNKMVNPNVNQGTIKGEGKDSY